MSMHPTKFAAIFDMDGVLLDSPKLNWQANNQVLGEYGVTIPTDQFHLYTGRTVQDSVEMFNKTYSLDLKYEDFKDKTDAIKKELFTNIQPKEGVVALLSSLRFSSISMAVATSMPRALTEQRLATAGILNMFDVLVTEDDVSNHKPHPEVFLKAASLLDVTPLSSIVFEDAPAGVRAANAAHMKCIAVQTSFIPRKKLQTATAIVDSLEHVNMHTLQNLFHSSPK